MGTSLTGLTPSTTYDSLIKVTDNGPLTASLKKLTDGLGNDSPLSLSTTAASVAGTTTIVGGDGLYINSSVGDVSNIFTSPSTHGLFVDFPSTYFMAFRGPAELMRITSNGYLRLSATSGGIQFNGDTAAANALDDYEEGTWTMGVSFGGASVGATYSLNTGTYTKIGRQVTVNGLLAFASKGSSAGIARITGLPFTVAGSSGNFSAPAFRTELITNTGVIQGYCNIGTTLIPLEQVSILGTTTSITDTDFSNNTTIIVLATYFV